MSESPNTPTNATPATSAARSIADGIIPTEQINPRTTNIDKLASLDVLKQINHDDKLVAPAVEAALPAIAPVVDAIIGAFNNNGRLFYFGAGTSGRLGVLDASECPPTYGADPSMVQGIIAGGDHALRHAVEGAEDSEEGGRADVLNAGITHNDVVVGLSASGHAPYVHGVIKQANALGAVTSVITCHAKSDLATLATHPISVDVGPEVIAGSTRMKAGTAQKLILNMLTTSAMIQIGKTYQNLMVDVRPSNDKLKLRASRLISKLGQCEPSQADMFLHNANNQVKPAILMAKLHCTLGEANEKLKHSNGKLHPWLTT